MSRTTQEQRWAMVLAKQASDSFVYGVTTTGVYSRPDCSSRTPRRENVVFFEAPGLAEAQGYRACRRCRPRGESVQQELADKISAACTMIKGAEAAPTLKQLAARSGLSPFYFQRSFKAVLGITPKAFAQAHRMQKLREGLGNNKSNVTAAMYAAGFSSSSRFYETATRALGMTPTRFKQGGAGAKIVFAVGEGSLGSVLVACSSRGVCAILLGDSPEQVLTDFQARFSKAQIVAGDAVYDGLVARVIAFVDAPRLGLDLPLDLQGTSFQERVWQALRTIPAGATASYAEIAAQLGAPKAFRAVASACAANALAVAIPCHRVVRADGALSGYRWGIDRKRQLLEKERGPSTPS